MKLLNLSLLEDKHYILGLSGGCDSVSLFHLLLQEKISFQAIHFNHNLRSSAINDEFFCRQLCQKFQVKFEVIPLHISPEKSIENQARQKRLRFYERNYKEETILLAHHQGDYRENFLIRFLRGSNISGLTGLKEKNIINQVTYLRPLLKQEPKDLKKFLQSRCFSWCEDETNQQNTTTRNTIRNIILPQLAQLKDLKSINRTIELCYQDAEFLDQLAFKRWQNLTDDLTSFQQLAKPIFARIISLIYQDIIGQKLISIQIIERAYKEIHQKHTQGIQIPLKKNFTLTITQNNKIYFSKNQQPITKIWNWKQKQSINLYLNYFFINSTQLITEQFNLQELTSPLVIRFWKQGDKMIPWQQKSPKKIKDIFINAKIPLAKRKEIPLLIHNETIIWIPTVMRSNFAPISKNSQNISISYEYKHS